jgi:hypothetical protein
MVECVEVGVPQAAGAGDRFRQRNAMSFMQPRTLRSAVLARMTSSSPRLKVAGGRFSRRSSRSIRWGTRCCVARRSDARTSASKRENSVAEWVGSRHLRRSDHNRFAYQSSGSGAGTGSVAAAGPMMARSFLVHRRITRSSYGQRVMPSLRLSRSFSAARAWGKAARRCAAIRRK